VSVPIIAFFNNKGGVGKTTLVYHLAWMFADLGVKVLAVDMDPQANLTTAFRGPGTSELFRDLKIDDPTSSLGQVISDGLVLLSSDLMLPTREEELAVEWQGALGGNGNAFGALSPRWRLMRDLERDNEAQLILLDLGPNLSAINRASLIAADHIVVPLAPDMFSVQGLEILGSTLRKWRVDWRERLACSPSKGVDLPAGAMTPLGYVVLQTGVAMRAFEDWINWIPDYYRKFVLDDPPMSSISILNDPNKLGILRPYRSLLEMAREARKPMFHLKPADGAIGAYLQSAEDARKDFEALARAIVSKANLPISFSS